MTVDVPEELKIEPAFVPLIATRLVAPPTLTDREIKEQQDLEEEYISIRGQLLERLFQLIELHATQRQKSVIALLLSDYTYQTIADILDLNYTTVFNCYNGTLRGWGGFEKKFQRIALADQECLRLLKKIRMLRIELG